MSDIRNPKASVNMPNPPTQNDDNPVWGNAGAFGYSAMNEGLMGLPDFLVKNVGGSKAYQDIQDLEKKYPLASTLGGATGTVGSMFIPGMGAGKALATAGKGLASSLARGGVMAAKQAVPRALTGVGTDISTGQSPGQVDVSKLPESLARRGNDAAVGTVLGAAVNPAAEKIGQIIGGGFSGAKKAIEDRSIKQFISGLGGDDQDIIKLASYGAPKGGEAGTLARNAYSSQRDLANYMKEEGIKDQQSMGQYLLRNDGIYNQVKAMYDKAPPSPWEIFNKVKSSPYVSDLVKSGRITDNDIKDIASTVWDNNGRMLPYDQSRQALDNQAKALWNRLGPGGSKDAIEIGRSNDELSIVSALKKAIADSAFDRPGVTASQRSLHKNWGMHEAIQDIFARNAVKLKSVSENSGGGAINTVSNPAIARILGGALGSGAGLAAAPQDSSPLERSLYTLGGMASGAALPNFAANTVNKGMTSLASRLLPKAIPGAVSQPFSGEIQKPVSQGIQRLKDVASSAPSQLTAINAPGTLSDTNDSMKYKASEPLAKAPNPQKIGSFSSSAPISMGGDKIEINSPLKIDMNSMAGQRIVDNLNRIYEQYKPTNNGKEMTKQEFFDYAVNSSGGFDIGRNLEKYITSDPNERKQLAEAIPRLRTLTNPNSINWDLVVDPIQGNNGLSAETNRSNSNLAQLIARLSSSDPSTTPSPRDIQVANDLIGNIRNQIGPSPVEKKRMILERLAEKNFPLDTLKSLGLLQGTQLEGVY